MFDLLTSVSCFQVMMSANKLLVVDADPGVDDALAILMALSSQTRHLANLLAITTVRGNVDINQICLNALRVLQVAGRLDVRHASLLRHATSEMQVSK